MWMVPQNHLYLFDILMSVEMSAGSLWLNTSNITNLNLVNYKAKQRTEINFQ